MIKLLKLGNSNYLVLLATLSISFFSAIEKTTAEGFSPTIYWQVDEVSLKEDVVSYNEKGCAVKSRLFYNARMKIECPTLNPNHVDGCTYTPVDVRITATLCPLTGVNSNKSKEDDKVTIAHINIVGVQDFDKNHDLRPSQDLKGVQFIMKCEWLSYLSSHGGFEDGRTDTECSQNHFDLFFSGI